MPGPCWRSHCACSPRLPPPLQGSPGHEASHFDPSSALFVPSERNMVLTSNAFLIGMLAVLAAGTFALGPVAMFNL